MSTYAWNAHPHVCSNLQIQIIFQSKQSSRGYWVIKSDIMMCVIRTNNCYVQSMVKLTNARNVQLHISYNGMGNSECEVEIVKAFNSTVHLSFQVLLVLLAQNMRQKICKICVSSWLYVNCVCVRTPGTPRSKWQWMTPPSPNSMSAKIFHKKAQWRYLQFTK